VATAGGFWEVMSSPYLRGMHVEECRIKQKWLPCASNEYSAFFLGGSGWRLPQPIVVCLLLPLLWTNHCTWISWPGCWGGWWAQQPRQVLCFVM